MVKACLPILRQRGTSITQTTSLKYDIKVRQLKVP